MPRPSVRQFLGDILMIDREILEQQAMECCSAEDWYELLDCLEETPDSDLIKLIESSGSVVGG